MSPDCLRDELGDANAVGVERLARIDVADLANRAARDLLVVDCLVRRDLAGEDDLSALAQDFARHAAVRIAREMRVEDGVGDEVADLVGVPFADRLRRERVRAHMPTSMLSWSEQKGPRRSRRGPVASDDLDGFLRIFPARGPSNRGNRRASASYHRRPARQAIEMLQCKPTRLMAR